MSYDYQFDTNHADKFMCMCGAVKCRGTMKGGKLKVYDGPNIRNKEFIQEKRIALWINLVAGGDIVKRIKMYEHHKSLELSYIRYKKKSMQTES